MFLLSLRTHESMEIQLSPNGIHRKWSYWQPTWDQKVISAPLMSIGGKWLIGDWHIAFIMRCLIVSNTRLWPVSSYFLCNLCYHPWFGWYPGYHGYQFLAALPDTRIFNNFLSIFNKELTLWAYYTNRL